MTTVLLRAPSRPLPAPRIVLDLQPLRAPAFPFAEARRRLSALCLGGYVLASAALSLYAAARPVYNWDLVPYVAMSLASADVPVAQIQERTYDLLRQSLPPAAYEDLTRGPYRQEVSRDPAVFSQQLAFYRVKILYAAILRALDLCGVSP